MRKLMTTLVVAICVSAGRMTFAETVVDVGVEFTGKLAGPKEYIGNIDDFRNSIPAHNMKLVVELSDDMNIQIAIDVKGDGRKVGFLLEDPAGTRVLFADLAPMRIEKKLGALNATGKYRLIVLSDRIGSFTLNVTNLAATKKKTASEVEALEERLARLKKELAQIKKEIEMLEARLKADSSKD